MSTAGIIIIVVIFLVCLAIGWIIGVKKTGKKIREKHKNQNEQNKENKELPKK